MSFTTTRFTPTHSRVMFGLMATAALLWVAAPARAELLNQIQLDFQNGSGSGSFLVNVPAFTDQFQWDLPSPVSVYADGGSGVLLGTIKELTVTLDGDPGITLGFNVDATNVATHVSFSSAVVTYAPLANTQGFASAAITVTDNDSNGATVTGLLPGSTAYQAEYNGGTVFANLLLPIAAAVDGSSTTSGRLPPVGNLPLGITSSIHTQFDFMLSANDSASGTSRFNVVGDTIVPEPSTLLLASTGAIGLIWRLRRRRLA